MEYIVEYSTENKYENEVRKGHFELMVKPCTSPYQTLKYIDFQHNLHGTAYYSKTHFNFESLHIHTENRFQYFNFQLQAKVEKSAPNFLLDSQKSPDTEKAILEDRCFQIEQASFYRHSNLTQLSLQDIPFNWLKTDEENVGTYLAKLNQEIRKHLTYKTGVTNPHTTAQEVLQKGAGVCQDFSHLMLGVLRLQNIPARYVSGYLNSNSETGTQAQLHAWIEAYIPFLGWKGFDPTNQLLEDENYIKIAHGKDYSDCQPIKGVLQTDGANETQYRIKVTARLNQEQ